MTFARKILGDFTNMICRSFPQQFNRIIVKPLSAAADVAVPIEILRSEDVIRACTVTR